MPDSYSAVVTCEHGGNVVPDEYSSLFGNRKALLESHRGYDYGALEIARKLSSSLKCPLYYSEVTRLLVDLNRSPDNPRRFSEFVRGLRDEEKEKISALYYRPYRVRVGKEVENLVMRGNRTLHISVHTFTPVLKGKKRNADIGLLYDPDRKREAELCTRWRKALLSADGSLRVRRNYPYKGTSDGLTSFMRRLYRDDEYIGIEVEVNQKFPRGDRAVWLKLMRHIALSLASVLKTAA